MRKLLGDNWPTYRHENDLAPVRDETPPDLLHDTVPRLEALQDLAEPLEDDDPACELMPQLDPARLRLREVLSGGLTTVTVGAPPCLAEVFRLHAAVERRLAQLQPGMQGARKAIGAGQGRALGVTSAVRGEGKTTVALQLALHAAQSSHQAVCLVELGLTGDELCTRMGIAPTGEGLISLLEGTTRSVSRLRVESAGDLIILPAGKVPDNAARAVRSPSIGELLSVIREMFDLLIVDLPAMATDNALPLIDHLDGVVMVVRAGATPQKTIRQAMEQMETEKVLGLVLNRGTCSVPAWLRKRILGC